jgi:hypothetical protein
MKAKYKLKRVSITPKLLAFPLFDELLTSKFWFSYFLLYIKNKLEPLSQILQTTFLFIGVFHYRCSKPFIAAKSVYTIL